MKAIIFEITMLVLCVAFVIFLARDDAKNRRLREEEDKQKALAEKQRAESDKSED